MGSARAARVLISVKVEAIGRMLVRNSKLYEGVKRAQAALPLEVEFSDVEWVSSPARASVLESH
eukprot:7653554-Pyramimonas_sp.AAC.1